jgi:hypothetical protein
MGQNQSGLPPGGQGGKKPDDKDAKVICTHLLIVGRLTNASFPAAEKVGAPQAHTSWQEKEEDEGTPGCLQAAVR